MAQAFVSGIFDLLHSGHIEFFKQAASYGYLHVAVASDRTYYDLKGRPPVNSEQERLYMVRSVSFVKDAFIARGTGILDSLRDDWDAGLLLTRELLITADAFEGFLEQADYLLSEHYKDAAAVLVGGVLEATIRKICDVHGVPYGPKDTIEPLNVALARQTPPLYNKLVQKQITAWADLRNNAAHAHYDRYEEGNVADMLKWVREFAARHLA